MYLNLRYKPKKEDLVVEYYLEPNKTSLKDAADKLAGESSIGSWDKIKTLTPEIARKLKPSIFYLKNNRIKVAYTSEL